MKLHVIEGRDLSDIPTKLRQLANRIENAEVEAERCAVVVRTPEGPQVFGFGADADATHVFEDLHLGAAYLLDMLKHNDG